MPMKLSGGEIIELIDRLEAAEADALEQARLNGMGSEREAALMAKLEAAERSDAESLAMYRKARDERDAYKTAFEEWHQKTGWVQQGINDGSIPPTYLGWHRADVMADMLKSARRDYCVLEGYYTELAEKLEAAEKERNALRAKIERMERQEPVAWRTFDGEGGYDYRSYEDNENYKLGWDARYPNLIGWVEPLYALPGAQPQLNEIRTALQRALELGRRETWTGTRKHPSREDQREEQQCWNKVWSLLGAQGEEK